MAHATDHDFFIPKGSFWPPVICLGTGFMMFGFVLFKHADPAVIGQALMGLGLLTIIVGAMQWFKKLIIESRARGYKNVPTVLDLGNRYGMIFFITSEVMFFAAFFAAFFYLRSYNIEWPPSNIETLPIDLPVINTLLLLSSGVTITFAHHALVHGRMANARLMTACTWLLGIVFLACQMYEYGHAAFSLNSGVYGSVFYLLTGFHGLHVLLGSIMLIVLTLRFNKRDFTDKHHFYFEATAWYWHFVDVVWIGLFLFVYLL